MDRRLTAGDERSIDQLQAFDAVHRAAFPQRLERSHFAVVVRDDQLAASGVRHTVGGAKRVQSAGGPRHTAAPSASPAG